MNRRTLAIVPARGGSRGVPRKNIRMLAGEPVISWTLAAASACAELDRVIVSTDDQEIAEVARAAGSEVPFLRPAELARDETTDIDVYRHALGWLRENERYEPDTVAWLRPTSPCRTAEDISAALAVLQDRREDTVRSVCEVEHHPFWMFRLEDGRLLPFAGDDDAARYPRRQLLPTVYRLNGAVDAVRCAAVSARDHLFGRQASAHVMPVERSVDLDTEIDFVVAEALLRARGTQS